MKIAILAFSFLPHVGGAEIFTYNLSANLAGRGHQVHCYIPYFAYGRFKSLIKEHQFRVFPIFFQEVRFMRICPSLLRLCLLTRQMVFQYEIWQIIGAYPAGYIARTLSSEVPTVLRSYGLDIQSDASIGYGDRLDPRLAGKIQEALASMTKCIALTPTVKDCFRECAVPEDKIVEIPNGIDFKRFRKEVDRIAIRKRMGIDSSQILVLTVGRYHPKKGYDHIPAAARYLVDRGYNIAWVLVGRGTNRLRPEIERSGLGHVIACLEEVAPGRSAPSAQMLVPSDDLVALYKSADVFVLPSLLETFGMVIIEAMAAGLPVVATDAPGCRDVVRHECNGLLARPANPIDLAQCIERILTQSVLREQLITNALVNVAGYDWQHITDRYEQTYRQTIEERVLHADSL